MISRLFSGFCSSCDLKYYHMNLVTSALVAFSMPINSYNSAESSYSWANAFGSPRGLPSPFAFFSALGFGSVSVFAFFDFDPLVPSLLLRMCDVSYFCKLNESNGSTNTRCIGSFSKIRRLSFGSCRLLSLIYSHNFFTTSLRGTWPVTPSTFCNSTERLLSSPNVAGG